MDLVKWRRSAERKMKTGRGKKKEGPLETDLQGKKVGMYTRQSRGEGTDRQQMGKEDGMTKMGGVTQLV